MIGISRPAEVPRKFAKEVSAKTEALKNSHKNGRPNYDEAVRSLNFDSGIYGHHSVKNVLLSARRRKCRYCESKFSAASFGAIERFGPNCAARRNHGCTRLHLGYFWLAFEWTNLLVSCERCNTSQKRDFFRLRNREIGLAIISTT